MKGLRPSLWRQGVELLAGVRRMPRAAVATFLDFYDVWRAREARGREIDRTTNPRRSR